MKRHTMTIVALLAFVIAGMLVQSGAVEAQSNSTYTAVPPFVGSNTAVPNILLILDNSGSMNNRACESTSCGTLPDGSTSTTTAFTATTRYSGYFVSLTCYDYNFTDLRFEPSSTKASVGDACPGSLWDGNFLNWATFRRFDAVKKAMIGGDCSVARAADGTCPATGTPSMKTIRAQFKYPNAAIGHESIAVSLAQYTGRIPQTYTPGVPDPIYIHLRGGVSGAQATFCVDNDSSSPAGTQGDCQDGGAFTESQFHLRVAVTSEPQGVVQDVGTKARFGVMVFNTNSNGGEVLVGIGNRQSINLGGTATGVETYNNNTAALIDAIEEGQASTNTPLSETLYEGIRYVAQINSSITPNQYTFPIAFSGAGSSGVAFQSFGTGGIGSSEIKALTGSETCPAGYITDACGRDPYFFGSNHTPMWASPSGNVTCCKTFIIVFTDGQPTADGNVPAALQDYAHARHGLHCTGGSATIHTPNGTCNTNDATPASTLLGEHKTDYGSLGTHYLDDVAYWGHINDLRQATVPVINAAGHDLPGFQNVIVYSFFAFGNINGREILMQTARQGGFDDTNSDGIPQAGEYDKVNNVTGAPGADGVPDTYFESSNVDDLQAKLTQTISSILARSASGTSLSVLATSTSGEGALYQSFFFPKTVEGLTEVFWIGYTQGLFLDAFGNLREDTNVDGRLVYTEDKIIKTRFDAATGQVVADLFVDVVPSGGDGVADTGQTPTTVNLKDIKPIWESGNKLALRDDTTTPRKILTWTDLDNDGLVDSGEQIEFNAGTPNNSATLKPYIRAASSTEATNIINWIRGRQVTGYRNRELTVSGSLKTWKYGDTIHSTPTIVAAPRERFDVIYGDTTYSEFALAYLNRRQVAYVGANDGMLHAFNVGFYHPGDDPSTTTQVEHGWFTTQTILPVPAVTNTPGFGEELWAFIPQELLPQLTFLKQTDYQHVYYVDQKPRIADMRIFCDAAGGAPSPCVNGQAGGVSHPKGWGTVLIGSFRLGGSCQACPAGQATALSVTADFDYNAVTPDTPRTFYSAYFALDITDPEQDPQLLWSFTDTGLGLSLGYPGVARVRPGGGDKSDAAGTKWLMVVGSGPTDYDAGSSQTANIYVVDIIARASGTTVGTVYYKFPTPNLCGAVSPNSECSFMGNVSVLDTDLDYRADIIYFGNVICNGSAAPCNGSTTPTWKGKLYRLTIASSANPTPGTETDPCLWGFGAGACLTRTPTVLLNDFACTGSCTGANLVGPVTAAPNVAMDDGNKLWVYWGTGRYFSSSDKTNADAQYFFGVKDPVATSTCSQTSVTSCTKKDLVNVSAASVCIVCSGGTNQVTGVTGVDNFDQSGSSTSLTNFMINKDGWFTTLPDARERALSMPTIVGGIVFFPTFVPVNDVCSTSGTSFLYALYYKTGTAYKESVIGTTVSGSNTNVNRRLQVSSSGMASGLAVQIGAQGSGANGATSSSGCQGRLTGFVQSSTGDLNQFCMKSGEVPWSYYISVLPQRD